MKNINAFFQFLTGQVRGYSKSRSSSRRFKAYYLDTKNDTKGVGAKIIDYFLGRMLIFVGIFSVLFIEFRNIYIALMASIIILTLMHIMSIEIRNKKIEKGRVKKRRYIASQKVYKEIMNKTQEELKNYVTELLVKMNFSNLSFSYIQNKAILYSANLNNEKLNILFLSYKNDLDVEVKDIKEMIQSLVKNEVKKGIVITTSDFTKDCYTFIEQLTGKYKLMLVNKDTFLKLIEKNGMFPKDEEIDELIENKISKKERKLKEYKDIALSPNKIKSYLFLFGYLFLASFYVPFRTYYMGVAVFALIMGLVSMTLTTIKRKNEHDETVNMDYLFKNF
ncbi:restriction endonuclease [Serpentinicella alkaliphila]|uniref:Restriction endonuclease n=1 Tax=Serpentinicella alkaliphila TaxID=1734049 RepID=A0A4R2TY67_9FIRM|nr:restriction endonuclease [Serpentinicella alkaliphila]QUH26792.1 restriction endonuclease [Serpentinicella alkaliphila]TCQ08012.1 restriction endonuclease [Serpentinicella alkaliphila]